MRETKLEIVIRCRSVIVRNKSKRDPVTYTPDELDRYYNYMIKQSVWSVDHYILTIDAEDSITGEVVPFIFHKATDTRPTPPPMTPLKSKLVKMIQGSINDYVIANLEAFAAGDTLTAERSDAAAVALISLQSKIILSEDLTGE